MQDCQVRRLVISLFCAAALLGGGFATTALADSASFSEVQSPADQLFHIDVTVEFTRSGAAPRQANTGAGTVRVSMPGVQARFDPARRAEPGGYDCAATNSVYGDPGSGFTCSTSGEAQTAGLAFPTSVTVHLLSTACYSPPAQGSSQPAVADVWAATGDPGSAPDASFELAPDTPCEPGADEPPVDAIAPIRCKVPRLKSLSLKRATSKLRNAGCARGKVRRAYSPKVKKGLVVSQSVKAGKRLKAGSRIGLVVSRGQKPA
jgi:hypothetical protein